MLHLFTATSSADYEYVGNGFDAGECGIKIKNLRPTDHGEWSCSVGLVNRTEEQRDYINVYINSKNKSLNPKHLFKLDDL